ncbi:MAG: glycoside hydrolase family 5 protein [Coxiellaceae bacterium]|nr:MAG: glycoside hydrolase family 5 protein [Coxiellaceae bacterium]
MMKFRLALLNLLLFSFVSGQALATTYSSTGVQNATSYTFVLSATTSANAGYCAEGGTGKACYGILQPGASQWVNLDQNNSSIDLEYDLCQSVSYTNGNPQCVNYVGHIGVSFNHTNVTLTADPQGYFNLLSPTGSNAPYAVTGTLNQPTMPSQISVYSTVPSRGVNLAGAEFGNSISDAQFPTKNDVIYFAKKGSNVIRLPIKWEYLQPTLSTYDAGYEQQIKNFIEYATQNGLNVILDLHNYMRYNHQIIGTTSAVTTQNFADVWAHLAGEYKDNSKVIFELMNEPHDMSTELVLKNDNAAIAAIRAAGAKNLILVPGNCWDGLYSWSVSWCGTPNSQVMTGIVDSANNFAIDVHEYFSAPTGGGGGGNADTVCVAPSNVLQVENAQSFVDWLRKNHYKAFLTEIGANQQPSCYQDVDIF